MKTILSMIIIGMVLFGNAGASIYGGHKDEKYDLVIIAPEKFIPSLQPLVNHKNSHGIKTFIKNVDEIYAEFEGRNKAEQIKYFIKYALETWNIKYVLLVGGRKGQSAVENWWIPVRYCHNEFTCSDGRVEYKFISDLYFADVYNTNGSFSSWDTDHDGIFGEWLQNKPAEDFIDLSPDVVVGRLPCRNVLEVKTIVNKIIHYEQKKCNDSWFKTIVAIGGDSFPKLPGYEGENYTQQGLQYMPDFNQIRLWTSTGSLKSWIDVVKAINNGCGFLWFSGGATPKAWGTHISNESIFWRYVLRNIEIPLLVNNEKLPVVINGGGCHNCLFNVSIGNTLDFRPFREKNWVTTPAARCMAEALLFKKSGGCIAMIGPAAIGHESAGILSHRGGCEWLDIHFFKEYNVNATPILGNAWKNTICNFLRNVTINWNDTTSNDDSVLVQNAEAWSLFGDPSLVIGGYQ